MLLPTSLRRNINTEVRTHTVYQFIHNKSHGMVNNVIKKDFTSAFVFCVPPPDWSKPACLTLCPAPEPSALNPEEKTVYQQFSGTCIIVKLRAVSKILWCLKKNSQAIFLTWIRNRRLWKLFFTSVFSSVSLLWGPVHSLISWWDTATSIRERYVLSPSLGEVANCSLS